MRFEVAHAGHIRLIDADLRLRDRREIEAAWGNPVTAMQDALAHSFYARTVFFEMQPLAIYGLAPMSMLAGHVRAWCFGTQAIDDHPVAFARASRFAVRMLFGHCSLMTNVVDKNDAPALRWLNWLGASLLDQEFCHGGHTFRQWVIAGGRKCQRA